MKVFDSKIFAVRLSKLIDEHKITKYKLAKDLGVNKQTVIFWCESVNIPKINYLHDIAVYFDVSSDYLIGLEDENGNRI